MEETHLHSHYGSCLQLLWNEVYPALVPLGHYESFFCIGHFLKMSVCSQIQCLSFYRMTLLVPWSLFASVPPPNPNLVPSPSLHFWSQVPVRDWVPDIYTTVMSTVVLSFKILPSVRDDGRILRNCSNRQPTASLSSLMAISHVCAARFSCWSRPLLVSSCLTCLP